MKYVYKDDRILLMDGEKEIGRVTFPIFKDDIRVLNHTFVDPEYRSGGVASKLVNEAYLYLKKQNLRAVATCPYVVKWFSRHQDKNDIIAKEEQALLGQECAIVL